MTNAEKFKEIFDGMTDEQKKIVQAMIDESDEDNINPNHYKSETSLECIEAMLIAFGSDMVIAFCLCNAWKYIWRWKNKNGVEDLKKAEWYIEKGRELLGNDLDLTFGSTNIHQRFDSMADYINSILKHSKQKTESNEDIIRDGICGRCKHELIPEDEYPCNTCIYGVDNREDLWGAKEDE